MYQTTVWIDPSAEGLRGEVNNSGHRGKTERKKLSFLDGENQDHWG